jgi:hypothetical protein
MKNLLFPLTIMFLSTALMAQNTLQGSWKLVSVNGKNIEKEEATVKIYDKAFFAFGAYHPETNEFLYAGCGTYSFEAKNYSENLQIYTRNEEALGKEQPYDLKLQGNRMTLKAEMHGKSVEEIWEKADANSSALTGLWRISGRLVDDEMRNMPLGDRKTLKILSGNHYQWIAFNSATGVLSGTGGGMYSVKDGKYIEHIRFMSRNNELAAKGLDLHFDFEVKEGNWHHVGFSTVGNPINEVWEPFLK